MAGLKEVRQRIKSVNNTRQITRAMKLVSAAKLRRAQEAAENGREFSLRLGSVMRKVLQDLSGEFSHPLLEQAETVNLRRVIYISGERGLCGPYNSNVQKAIQQHELHGPASLDFVAIGRRSVSTCRRLGWKLVAEHEGLPENAALWPIEELAEQLIRDFESHVCQEVVLYYTNFVSAMTQKVTREVLLPFSYDTGGDTEGKRAGDAATEESQKGEEGYLSYSPRPEEILARLIPVVLRTKLRQAALESKASEHAARMTAMDSATNNANELIDKLRLHYNRARQSTITTELIDIIGGAEAIS